MFFWKKPQENRVPRLNTDVLWAIIPELSPHDLSSATRVCKEWLSIAQPRLYHRVAIRSHRAKTHILANRLANSSHLRKFVRHLVFECFGIGEGWYKLLLAWVSLLPEHSILSVTLSGRYDDMSDILMNYPAIRTARHIILGPSILLSRGRLATILSSPHLQRLSMAGQCIDPLVLPDGRLNLQQTPAPLPPHIVPSHVPAVLEFLPSTTQLTRLDVQLAGLHPHEANRVSLALQRHAQSLVRVAFISRGRLTSGPFMDDLAPLFVSARYLCCAYGTYTIAGLLSQLPPALHTLVLAWGTDGTTQVLDPNGHGYIVGPHPDNVPFPSEELAMAIASLPCASLTHLSVVLPDIIRDQCLPVAEACASCGISFKRVSMSDALEECMTG